MSVAAKLILALCLIKTVAAAPQQGGTTSSSGPTPRDLSRCQFPFIYKGVNYLTCTTKDDPDGKPWCSTKTDGLNNHIKGNFGPCSSTDRQQIKRKMTVATAPQQGGTTSSSGPTPRACGSFEAVSHTSGGLPSFDSSALIDLGGMAAVYNSTRDFRSSTHICGATLLSDRHLITAAHCVAGNGRTIGITVGREDINDKRRNVDNEYAIQKIVVHPSYNPAAHEYNDIAILVTDRKIKFTNKIYPFCLPDGKKIYDDYQLMQISGWGEVSHDNRASVLQSAYVNIIRNSRCESLWRRNTKLYGEFGESSYPRGITNEILCAGRDGVDACKGDTGGPLSNTDKEGRKTVVGIIAKRTGCPDFPEPPGFYTNTAHYIDWIYETTGIPHPSVTDDPLCTSIPLSKCSIPLFAEQCPNKCAAAIPVTTRPQPKPSTPKAIPVTTRPQPKPSTPKVTLPTDGECATSLSNNVVGGTEAKPGQFPWLAALLRKNAGEEFQQFCGGTLITKQHVLTAAHCFNTRKDKTIVRIGEHNLEVENDGAQDFEIIDERFSNYNRTTKENDIMLLKLDRPVEKLSDSIGLACLPQHLPSYENFEGKKGENLIIVGWGTFRYQTSSWGQKFDETPSIPITGTVPSVSLRICQETYKNELKKINSNKIFKIDNRQFCAGTGGTDSCKGDSGGPIHYLDLNKERLYVIGVVSFGPNPCGTPVPGVYTRIGHFLDWIKENIN